MKIVFKYCLISMLLFAGELYAQEIHYTVFYRNSDCNDFNNGSAEINVVPAHPPYSYLWNFGSTNKSVKNLAPGNYSVIVSDTMGNDTLISIIIGEKLCEISAPIVFTPNGDGFNDEWGINNIQYYPDNLVLVYNRWGQKVFEHKGEYEPWDGRDLFGVPVPDNSYYYIIYGDKKDEKSIVKGSVSILR